MTITRTADEMKQQLATLGLSPAPKRSRLQPIVSPFEVYLFQYLPNARHWTVSSGGKRLDKRGCAPAAAVALAMNDALAGHYAPERLAQLVTRYAPRLATELESVQLWRTTARTLLAYVQDQLNEAAVEAM